MSESKEEPAVPAVAAAAAVPEVARSEVSPSEAASDNSASEEPQGPNMSGIEYPGKHDVKLGRGGDANSHIGNIKFRQLIAQYKPRYVAASRSNKPFVAEEVVQVWRGLDPPGRFLIRTDPSLGDDSTWHDVGNRRSRKKASQALREKDRSEDMIAALTQGGMSYPGMPMMAPSMASAPVAHMAHMAPMMHAMAPVAPPMAAFPPVAAVSMAAPAAAPIATTGKRDRPPEEQERKISARTAPAPSMDPLAAAKALQQLLQPSSYAAPGSQVPAPAPQVMFAAPAPQSAFSAPVQQVPVPAPAPQVTVPAPAQPAPAPSPQLAMQMNSQAVATPAQGQDPNVFGSLLPALQLLLKQKQQQEQLQRETQKTLSTVATALQSLMNSNQSRQQQQQAGALTGQVLAGQITNPNQLNAVATNAAPPPSQVTPNSSQGSVATSSMTTAPPAQAAPSSVPGQLFQSTTGQGSSAQAATTATNAAAAVQAGAPLSAQLTPALASQLAAAVLNQSQQQQQQHPAPTPISAAPSNSNPVPTQSLDRMLATRILESLLQNSAQAQQQRNMV